MGCGEIRRCWYLDYLKYKRDFHSNQKRKFNETVEDALRKGTRRPEVHHHKKIKILVKRSLEMKFFFCFF